jgi:hypothetical protein
MFDARRGALALCRAGEPHRRERVRLKCHNPRPWRSSRCNAHDGLGSVVTSCMLLTNVGITGNDACAS